MHSAAHDDWDSRFPVDSAFLPSISLLQEHCASYPQQLIQPVPKPMPHFLRSTSPALSARRNASLRNLAALARPSPTSPRLIPTPLGSSEPITSMRTAHTPDSDVECVGRPIESTAQFLEWYGAVEEQLAQGQDMEAHAFAELLRQRSTQCAQMQKRIEDVQGLLTLMSDGYRRVCAQTESVKTACQGLQSRQAQLSDASGRIAETLRVYDSLAPIAQLVNRPGDRVCLDKGFLPALDRCESAIEFLGQHPARDSELYLMRFSQCRMRALTLIKIHALRVFRSLSSESMREPQSAHTRFQAASRSLSPLLRALQTRAHQPTERQVWVDVVTAYFAARRAFLRPHLKRNLDRISSESAQAGDAPVDAMRDWCAFTMGLCADEHRLYSEFFEVEPEDVEMLRGHLDQTMAAFYEHVRPLIIHESDVHVLASLSLTLLTFQRSAPDYDEDAGGLEEHGLDAFYAAIDHTLQDAQQRLAYKAQSFIHAHISAFRISSPAPTTQWLNACRTLHISDANVLQTMLDQLPEDQRTALDYVHPPVTSYRWLVDQIDGCLDEHVLEGILEEAAAACKQNLLAQGARFVREQCAKESEAEQLAHLFVTWNLLRMHQSVLQ